jgi:lysophospholipase L1-like esterase
MKRMKIIGFMCLLIIINLNTYAIDAALTGGIGDVDTNGDVNIIDALLVAQFYVGLNPQSFDQTRADYNQDGNINIIDALLIAQLYVGLIEPSLPGELYNIAINQTASSDSNQTGNEAQKGNDGNTSTRWCAADGATGHWWQVDLGANADIAGVRITWEMTETVYQYYIDVSQDNSSWDTVVDMRTNADNSDIHTNYFTANARYVRITVSGLPDQIWASMWECEVLSYTNIPAATPVPTLAPLSNLTIYIAGDSTVQDYINSSIQQAGWGQMLPEYFSSEVTIDNRAIGGRTARRFIDEGRLDQILNVIQPEDYLFVQFGTNDGHPTATYIIDGITIPYYLDPQTDFKTYLQMYIDGIRSRNAHIIFITPPPRNSAYCTGGNGTGAHAQAIRELGADQDVPVVDLNQMTVDYLKAICPAPVPEDFFLIRADGTVDGTHFQENGARIMAGFIAGDIRSQGLPLASYLK